MISQINPLSLDNIKNREKFLNTELYKAYKELTEVNSFTKLSQDNKIFLEYFFSQNLNKKCFETGIVRLYNYKLDFTQFMKHYLIVYKEKNFYKEVYSFNKPFLKKTANPKFKIDKIYDISDLEGQLSKSDYICPYFNHVCLERECNKTKETTICLGNFIYNLLNNK